MILPYAGRQGQGTQREKLPAFHPAIQGVQNPEIFLRVFGAGEWERLMQRMFPASVSTISIKVVYSRPRAARIAAEGSATRGRGSCYLRPRADNKAIFRAIQLMPSSQKAIIAWLYGGRHLHF